MPIDSSIYSTMQTPDIVGNYAQGIRLRQLADKTQAESDQLQRDRANREAYDAGIVKNPDGTTSFDRSKTLSAMAGKGLGKEYVDATAQFSSQDAAKAEAQRKAMVDKFDLISRLAGSVKDQGSLDQAKAVAKQSGLDTSMIPDQYDPANTPKILNQISMISLSKKDQLENSMKQQELSIKQQDLALQRAKLYGGGIQNPGSPGAMQAPGGQATDPALLVPSYVPEKHQEKAFGEIEAAQNTRANKDKILESFDNAANKIHGVDFVPGMQNADQKSYHALLGPTFKDVEGTVRQAAMDNMYENTTPQFGDSKETIAKKRSALEGYLTSKSSAPVAKGYGIDLTKFPSTNLGGKSPGQSQQAISAQAHPEVNAAVTWAKSNPQDPRAQEIMKRLGQ